MSRGKYLVELARKCASNNSGLDYIHKPVIKPQCSQNTVYSANDLLATALLEDCDLQDDMAYCSPKAVEVPAGNQPNPDIQDDSYLISLSTMDDYNEDSPISTGDSNYRGNCTLGIAADEIQDPTWMSSKSKNDDDGSSSSNGSEFAEETLVSNHTIQNQMPEEHQKLASEPQNKRKKQCTPDEWIRNQRKRKRNMGLAYISSRKKQIKEREMLQGCNETCIFKCSEKFSEVDRTNIFKSYWNMGNLQNQRNYILRCMNDIPHSTTKEIQRKVNHAFYFETNSKKSRVCKAFFIRTLGISDRTVRTVIAKANNGILEDDMRGKHGHQIKVNESIKPGIVEHINSIPRIESHYLRAQTSREFIDGGKTLADIHRDYVNKCKQDGKPFGNYTMFSRIFKNNFNISFFTPKKDQCGTCEHFKNSTEDERQTLLEKYEHHVSEKELSRLEKEKDKIAAKAKQCICACFDLQAVLQTPCGDISTFYYKSKLSTYNFTIFDLGTLNGNCFVWHEGEGNRGASEIGTCLYKFLESSAKDLPIVLYCDNCCGQNKNKFIACLLLYTVRKLNIPSIDLKFLVVGHTQNEGDNMHSLIEKQKKRFLKSGPIYTPAQWIPIISNAKKTGEPYKVIEMDYCDFYDLKSLQEQMGSNFNINEHGEKVMWSNISVLRFIKTDPSAIFYKNSYKEEAFKKISIRKAGRISMTEVKLNQLYSNSIKISQNKIDALSELCTKYHIKIKYHDFYRSLGCSIGPAAPKTINNKKTSTQIVKLTPKRKEKTKK